jgi:hypothetical protein
VGNDFDESLLKYRKIPGFYYFVLNQNKTYQLTKLNSDSVSLIKRLARKSALVRYIELNLKFRVERMLNRLLYKKEKRERYIGNTSVSTDSERVKDSIQAIRFFLDQLPLQTGLSSDHILFLIDGIRPHVYSDAGLLSAKGSYFDTMRNRFMWEANQRGYEIIDMQPIFFRQNRRSGDRFEFKGDFHWNALGHSLAARAIGKSSVFSRTFLSE